MFSSSPGKLIDSGIRCKSTFSILKAMIKILNVDFLLTSCEKNEPVEIIDKINLEKLEKSFDVFIDELTMQADTNLI